MRYRVIMTVEVVAEVITETEGMAEGEVERRIKAALQQQDMAWASISKEHVEPVVSMTR